MYHFPAELGAAIMHEDHQSSSYDTEYCWWSNIPDNDFAADEDYEWCMGQFVWTGFDYLGEPSPYDTDAWPNHSSVFGIVDLAYIPKDRFYLYRSQWNKEEETLHILREVVPRQSLDKMLLRFPSFLSEFLLLLQGSCCLYDMDH